PRPPPLPTLFPYTTLFRSHHLVRLRRRDADQSHHAVARVQMLAVPCLLPREPVSNVRQRAEDVGHGHALAVPHRLRVRLHGAHGRCHSRPSAFSRCAASSGPHVPAGYIARGGRPLRHAFSIGSTSIHAASTSSARVNSVGSPIMQSRSSRS